MNTVMMDTLVIQKVLLLAYEDLASCVAVAEMLIRIQLATAIRKLLNDSIISFAQCKEKSDRTTGHCLRCTRNTYGVYCEKCLPGHWGDALLDIKCHGK